MRYYLRPFMPEAAEGEALDARFVRWIVETQALDAEENWRPLDFQLPVIHWLLAVTLTHGSFRTFRPDYAGPWERPPHTIGVLNVVDTGLGKTYIVSQFLGIMRQIFERRGFPLRVLVLAELSTFTSWRRHLLNAGFPDAEIVNASGPHRTGRMITISSYNRLATAKQNPGATMFSGYDNRDPYNFVVADEVHIVRNSSVESYAALALATSRNVEATVNTEAVRAAVCQRPDFRHFSPVVVGLTATPNWNRCEDIRNIQRVLMAGNGSNYERHTMVLNKVVANLRPLHVRELGLEMEPWEREIYDQALRDHVIEFAKALGIGTEAQEDETIRRELLARINESVANKRSLSKVVITHITALRQICMDPAVVIPNRDEARHTAELRATVKTRRALEIALARPRTPGNGLLFVCECKTHLHILADAFERAGLKSYMITGDSGIVERDDILRRFAVDGNVLGMSYDIAQGLNLQRLCNEVLFLHPAWTPAGEKQATDRIHRLGQAQDCYKTTIYYKDTIEDYMRAVTAHKRGFDVFELAQGTMRTPTKQDVVTLRRVFERLIARPMRNLHGAPPEPRPLPAAADDRGDATSGDEGDDAGGAWDILEEAAAASSSSDVSEVDVDVAEDSDAKRRRVDAAQEIVVVLNSAAAALPEFTE